MLTMVKSILVMLLMNEDGFRVLLTLIPSKYKNEVSDWFKGLLDPIDEQSKKKAYELLKLI